MAPALQPVGRELVAEAGLAPYLSATSTVIPRPGEPGTYLYRIRVVSGAGEVSEPSQVVKVDIDLDKLPNEVNDASTYPNPVDTRISDCTFVYTLKRDVQVTLRLYTILGALVREWTFDAGTAGGQSGTNEMTWDGTNAYGEKVATQILLLRIHAATEGVGNTVIIKVGVIH